MNLPNDLGTLQEVSLHSRPILSMVWFRVRTLSSLLMAIPFGSQLAERFSTLTGCSLVRNHHMTDIYAVVGHVLRFGLGCLRKKTALHR